MKRSKVLALGDQKWIKPLEGDSLEIAIVPAAVAEMSRLSSVTDNGGNVDSATVRVCQRLFVDFRNYEEDDGQPVRNTLRARLELFAIPPIQRAILLDVGESVIAVTEGNEEPGSDSPDTPSHSSGQSLTPDSVGATEDATNETLAPAV